MRAPYTHAHTLHIIHAAPHIGKSCCHRPSRHHHGAASVFTPTTSRLASHSGPCLPSAASRRTTRRHKASRARPFTGQHPNDRCRSPRPAEALREPLHATSCNLHTTARCPRDRGHCRSHRRPAAGHSAVQSRRPGCRSLPAVACRCRDRCRSHHRPAAASTDRQELRLFCRLRLRAKKIAEKK